MDKHPTDDNGRTPLHFGALSGHLEVCQAIMVNVVDKNPSSVIGRTPLHCAAEHGHLEVCRAILANVVDKNPMTNNKREVD